MALDSERRRVTPEQLRELDVDELQSELVKLREAQFRLRFRSATEDISADNPMRIRTMRRNIARIVTLLRERTQG
ncbi:MAG TPA: 50S ribosomal protein L29 [Gemmatimonadales bacterium]